jgi:hypothetical protein
MGRGYFPLYPEDEDDTFKQITAYLFCELALLSLAALIM